ncbi:hypothetical protein ANO14919_091530 [Xylariales sp. No.14919]|nr:hypothetical protein ANO14919_091530 [Xylariales sp. No.14919]
MVSTCYLSFMQLTLERFHKKEPPTTSRVSLCLPRSTARSERFAGRPERLSSLRATCLIHDRHLCVISRRFGQQDALKRMKEDRKGAKDDDGNLLVSQPRFGKLEVAHILPRSQTRIRSGSELSASKQAAIAILNMLDGGVGHLIQGTDIDQPRNALTLTADLHELFCDLPIYFNSTEQAHTYEIDSFVAPSVFQDNLQVARALYLTPTRTIDPPSPRLLAIHRAIAHIFHLSDAGEYIEKILQDVKIGIRADRSTELGRLVKLGLGGWVHRESAFISMRQSQQHNRVTQTNENSDLDLVPHPSPGR